MEPAHAVIHLEDVEHGRSIADKLKKSFVPDFDRAVSITSEGNLLGGVIYTDYMIRSISMHAAAWSPRWLTRDMLWTIFAYPFDNLHVEMCLAPVASTNARSAALCFGLGFKLHATILDVVPDGHMMILSMRREHCRWLNWKPRYLETAKKELSP